MPITGSLKPTSSLADIFPELEIPLHSILPMIPRDETCPPCYLAAGYDFTSEQVEALAQQLLEAWTPECADIEQAKAYIVDPTGIPLQCEHFTGVSVTGKHLHVLM